MQPIKTTNAMNPAPAKGIESFPTPVIDDVVIAEVVNAWKGDYQKLEYGTLWKDVNHAPNQGSFPEHKLVFQQPTSEDGQWIKRIWVNDRVNQDSYNYAIKYSAGSQQHPIYIRNYVVPRETYTPLPDGTPDPLFPIALLVDEEANRIEGELDSKYVSVTRVYETLPGPEVPTKRYNERGDLETVLVQTVPPNTPPDQDGLLVTGSQVVQEETGKGVKTTSTVQDHSLLQIKEKKEGLLGETITTDDIVAPSTNPDELSQTVVSSVVEQFSATKARKRTTTSTGPSSLMGLQNKEGLLGQVSITESIVAANSQADEVSLNVLSSVVEPIDKAKSRKTTVRSSGPTSLTGKNNKSGLLGTTVVTESIVAANANPDALSISVLQSQVDSIDSAKSKKTTVTSTGPTSLISRTLADSPTGAINAVKYNQIVNPNQVPVNSLNTLKYDVTAIDPSKSEAEIVQVDSWPIVRGVEFDDVTGLPIPYTEQVIPPSEYNDAWEPVGNTNYKPIDEYKAVKKQYNTNEIQQYYLSYLSVIETPVEVNLPDKLIDVTAYIARDYSEGKNVSDSNNVGGDSYGYTSGGGYKSSGAISADIYFKIEKGFDGYIDGLEVTFFDLPYKLDPFNTILSRNVNVLNALREKLPNLDIELWPTLKKVTQNILVFTGGKSKTTSFSNSEDVSINGFANSQRQDDSYDIDTNVNTVNVPDALYDSITIKEEKFGPSIPSDLEITGGVYPKTLPATNPAKFPVGNYLIRSDASIYRFGLVKITAAIAKITEDYV
jgi:hypothetical protein